MDLQATADFGRMMIVSLEYHQVNTREEAAWAGVKISEASDRHYRWRSSSACDNALRPKPCPGSAFKLIRQGKIMARNKSIVLSVLNITLHEHDTDKYIKLLQFIRRNQIKVRYHGDRHAMIGHLGRPKEDKEYLTGQILTFVELDPADQWLNTQTNKPAEDEDLESIQIPEHLKPGMRMYNFAFFPKKHRLVFESRSAEGFSLGPESARRIFEFFQKSQRVMSTFGPGEVTIEPSREALSKVLGIAQLKSLSIFITRPNPDDNQTTEEIVKERLERQNLKSLEENLKAESGKSIEPDEETVSLAQVAESNGYVNGSGKDDQGAPINESTKDHPMKERTKYDPQTQTGFDAFLNKAVQIVLSIGRR